MRYLTVDIETPLIPETGVKDVNKIFCIVAKPLGEAPIRFRPWDLHKFNDLLTDDTIIIAHNGVNFEWRVLNKVLNSGIRLDQICDTYIFSKLLNYSGMSTHSLAEVGSVLKKPKINFNDFSKFSEEQLEYCVQDVEITEEFFVKKLKKFYEDPRWAKAIETEHKMEAINGRMSDAGFGFNKPAAELLLKEVLEDLKEIEDKLQVNFPPELVEVNRILNRYKKDGTAYSTTANFKKSYDKVEVDGAFLVGYNYVKFNPGSVPQRIEKLWACGWQPWDKSKTHQEFTLKARMGEPWRKSILTPELYRQKKEYFEYYGWKVNEANLATLPEDAPEGAVKLAEWLTLEGRRSSLVEWISCCRNGRIHSKFWGLGAWTHRMAHSNPNSANISSPFEGEPKSGVDNIKAKYDYRLRALWKTDRVLVGTDADGIQLRILCHCMRSPEYREAIMNGDKEKGTDIHNVNRRALGYDFITRGNAKTFIYAWLLGAGSGMVAGILGITVQQAKQAVQNFLDSLPELKELKQGRIKSDGKRGYFEGLDGRFVVCASEYLMLAGYLQNGESIAMKMWIIKWTEEADRLGLNYTLVNFVHDEVQVEVDTEEDAHRLISIQEKAMEEVSDELNLFIPLTVSGDVGKNWLETH